MFDIIKTGLAIYGAVKLWKKFKRSAVPRKKKNKQKVHITISGPARVKTRKTKSKARR